MNPRSSFHAHRRATGFAPRFAAGVFALGTGSV
jgi:hypothetical protein